jgi:hypothetical protein
VAAGDTWRADELRKRVPARAWQPVSAGRGAKGHRFYDWAFVQLDPGDRDPDDPGQRWLLVRRNRSSEELAYYRCFMPHPVPLATLVNVAGRRWSIEERIKTSKGLCGLDQHQVRRWRSWYRWTTLAMLAHAFLVVAALADRTRHPVPAGLISLTCNEIQHLFAALIAQPVIDLGTGCAGRTGGVDIKLAPAAATTGGKPPGNHEDQDLPVACCPALPFCGEGGGGARVDVGRASRPAVG